MNPPLSDPTSPSDGPSLLRDRLLTATSVAAAEMLRGVTEQAIPQALQTLGESAEVSRVYVFRIDRDAAGRATCSQCHEWCAPGIAPQIDNPDLQNLPMAAAGFSRWLTLLSKDEPVAGDVARFPAEEQRLLRAQSIISLAVMPVHLHDQLWGFIGFDDCRHSGKWTHEVIECLRIAARVLAGAIDRLGYKARNDELVADNQQLIDSLDDVVFRFDAEGRWTLLSVAWLKRLGWAPDDCLGKPAIKYVVPEDRATALRNWVHVQAGKQQGYRGELRFRQAGGGFRWMLVAARAQRHGAGDIVGVTGTLTDVTAAKHAEAELIAARTAAEAANRSKSEFLSAMSHELRTPLNAVIGLSESLLDDSGQLEPTRLRRYLEIIHASGRELLAQINDILDFARIDAGRVQLARTAFDLRMLAAAPFETAQREIQAKKLRTELSQPATAVMVMADQRLLGQALHCLVDNAVKFTPPGGTIALDLSVRSEGGVCLAIRDSGIGIEPAKLDRVFEPFAQADATLSRAYRGTGLGLSLLQRIVRLHGGTVRVASTLGSGSTFFVELPPAVLLPQRPARAVTPPAVRRVLLVDDDMNQHTLVGDYLQRHGWEIVHCDRAETALEATACTPFGLGIVDLSLPGMSGLELIARLRGAKATASLPILAVTAFAGSEAAERCRGVGADVFLAKPVSLRALSAEIQSLTCPSLS